MAEIGPMNLTVPLRICGGLDGSIMTRLDSSISLIELISRHGY